MGITEKCSRMNKFNIVVVCAGVFCTAALSSVQGATCPVTGANARTVENALTAWINMYAGNWAEQTRGNNTKDEPNFGKHLKAGHESKVEGAPTLNLETNNLYSSGTQFNKGESLNAVDAFLQEINDGHVFFNTDKTTHGDGWCVTATLNGGNSLPYAVYAPWAGGGADFVEGRLQNLHIENEKDAAKCVPCWSSGNLYKLNFVFYIDKHNKNQYKLSTIYPVYDKGKRDSLFESKIYTPSSEVLDRGGFDDEDDGALAKKKYPNYYSANLKKAKKGKGVHLG